MYSWIKLQTLYRLGPTNLFRIAVYRFGLRTGLHPVVRAHADIDGDTFFGECGLPPTGLPPPTTWSRHGRYFGRHERLLPDGPPDWFANPLTGVSISRPYADWWRLPDFTLETGDIKTVWESSRFDWAPAFAQQARASDPAALTRLNTWLRDWCRRNPAYRGPNWKCGQEASIRVMHLALAARLLGQDADAQPDLMRLVDAHMRRISPTLAYALAQDNNHGTSEAAALFIGGVWSRLSGNAQAGKWAAKGRRVLEQRVKRLVAADGSFSQHSVNYHRLMLDTLCLTELWRQWHAQAPFSSTFYERAAAAADWLFNLLNPDTGDAPNLGSNDGANLLPLCDADYRDYRPSVQLAMAVFKDQRAYPQPGIYDTLPRWLNVKLPETIARRPASVLYNHGGYAVLRTGDAMALLKYPRYRFRPSHCDALHVDLWIGSNNLLRDAGSYSYNTEQRWMDYFPGTVAHNTIQFDDRDQMQRLGRFLRGAWLKADRVAFSPDNDQTVGAAAGYRDWRTARHDRRLRLNSDSLRIEDQIRGFSEKAVLRWRLMPGEWQLDRCAARCGRYVICVSPEMPVVRCELVEGWESRYYMEKTPIPVLEVEVRMPGRIITEVTW